MLTTILGQNSQREIVETEKSIVDYGELAIGVGTFLLGITVAIATWYSEKRTRKVHIADKRMEWVKTFRENVAELMEVMRTVNIIHHHDEKDVLFEIGEYEKELRRFYLIGERIGFMFPIENEKGTNLYHLIGKSYKIAERMDFTKKKGKKALTEMENDIYNLVDEIINEQLDKIIKLDSKTPLI